MRYAVLILGVVIMLSGVSLSYSIQGGFGSAFVAEVDFVDSTGAVVHSTLQRPVYATSANPMPGVVVIHGSLQNKEWLMAFGIELARRGFVVLTIDANGHGNTDPSEGRHAGTAAVDYLASLDYVDATEIGLIGHSMGGGYCWIAINESSVVVDALVLVGSGFWNTSYLPYVPNTLVAVGEFDSLSSYPSSPSRLDPWFNVTGVEPGVTYGSFSDNSARRLVLARTNHLFETIDPVIVSESVEWMKESLKDGIEDSYWLPSTELLYPLWLVGGAASLFGALLTIFPLLTILIDLPFFSSLSKMPAPQDTSSTGAYLRYGAIYGLVGAGTFFPFLAIGGVINIFIPFPQSNGLAVISWMLGSGIVAALVLYAILRRKGTQRSIRQILLGEQSDEFVNRFSRTLVLGIVIFVWLYVWTLIVDLGFALDLRCFLPGFHDLTLNQALMVPLYFAVFFFYFLVEGAWLTGPLLTEPKQTLMGTQVFWTAKAVLIKTIPYLILIAIEYIGGYLAGYALIPGMIGYSFLFFYAFTPWFAVAAVIALWGYRLTGNHHLGAILNGLICAWLLASILSF